MQVEGNEPKKVLFFAIIVHSQNLVGVLFYLSSTKMLIGNRLEFLACRNGHSRCKYNKSTIYGIQYTRYKL